MRAAALQSGSTGNCVYVEAGGKRLLFDAGIGRAVTRERLAPLGVSLEDIDAILISHEHRDHVCAAGILQRATGAPLWITERTLGAASSRMDLGTLGRVCTFVAGESLEMGPVHVETVPTAHDAVDGVGFVVVADGLRLGILTDLGHLFEGLDELVATLDAVFIESNYDPSLLESGPYPEWLKRRIAGPAGHLSNGESASLVERAAAHRLRWACLSHLSADNNRPDLALRAHRNAHHRGVSLHVASRSAATVLLTL